MRNELVVFNNPKSRMSEAIKTIRTNLQFAAIDKELKTILVTSSIAGEGKSFITANLACAFAAVNQKVLVIDCDLRRGRQHTLFNTENIKGLSNLLIDNISQYKKYISKTDVANISLLSMGILPPNPSELLGSAKNKDLMNRLREEYDIILFDCPPVNGLADTVIMTSLADAVIMVSSVNKTPIDLLEKAKKTLEQVNAKLVGVVVNRVDDKNSSHYYDVYYN